MSFSVKIINALTALVAILIFISYSEPLQAQSINDMTDGEMSDMARPNVMDAIDGNIGMEREFREESRKLKKKGKGIQIDPMEEIQGVTKPNISDIDKLLKKHGGSDPAKKSSDPLKEMMDKIPDDGCMPIEALVLRGVIEGARKDLSRITSDIIGKCLAQGSVKKIIKNIETYYKSEGFVNAFVFNVTHQEKQQTLIFTIIEGKVESIKFKIPVDGKLKGKIIADLQGQVARLPAIQEAVLALRKVSRRTVYADLSSATSKGDIRLTFKAEVSSDVKDATKAKKKMTPIDAPMKIVGSQSIDEMKDSGSAHTQEMMEQSFGTKQCFPLRKIDIRNATFLTKKDKKSIAKEFGGDCRTNDDIVKLTQNIVKRYEDAGYQLSFIKDLDWNHKSGTVILDMVEVILLQIRIGEGIEQKLVQQFLGPYVGKHANATLIEKALKEIQKKSEVSIGILLDYDEKKEKIILVLRTDTQKNLQRLKKQKNLAKMMPKKKIQKYNKGKNEQERKKCLNVKQIVFQNNTALSPDIISDIRSMFKNVCSEIPEIEIILKHINDWYKKNRYLSSFVSDFKFEQDSGTIKITVTEGKFREIRGTEGLKPKLYSKYLKPLIGTVAKVSSLSEALSKIHKSSDLSYRTSLAPFDGSADLVIILQRQSNLVQMPQDKKDGKRRSTVVQQDCLRPKALEIEGSTIVDPKARSRLSRVIVGKCIENKNIQAVAEKIQEIYKKRSLLSSGVSGVSYNEKTNSIVFTVIEKRIEDIRVESEKSQGLVNSIFADMKGEFVDFAALQKRRAKLLRSRSIEITLDIQPGSQENLEIVSVIITFDDKKRVYGTVGANNHGGRPYGYGRPTASGTVENIYTLNDFVSVSYNHSPLRPNYGYSDGLFGGYFGEIFGGNLSVIYSGSNYTSILNTGTSQFELYGGSDNFSINYTRKIIDIGRDGLPDWSFFAAARLDHKINESFIEDTTITIQTYKVTTIGAELRLRGVIGEKLHANFGLGLTKSLPWFNAAEGGVLEAGFDTDFRYLIADARLTYLPIENISLDLGVRHQFSKNKTLPSTEHFSIGGPGSIPGYRGSVSSNAEGYLIDTNFRVNNIIDMREFKLSGSAGYQFGHILESETAKLIRGYNLKLNANYKNKHILELSGAEIIDAPVIYGESRFELYGGYTYNF